jgi:hypothetical protein
MVAFPPPFRRACPLDLCLKNSQLALIHPKFLTTPASSGLTLADHAHLPKELNAATAICKGKPGQVH